MFSGRNVALSCDEVYGGVEARFRTTQISVKGQPRPKLSGHSILDVDKRVVTAPLMREVSNSGRLESGSQFWASSDFDALTSGKFCIKAQSSRNMLPRTNHTSKNDTSSLGASCAYDILSPL